ncbi:hypothetical protein C2W59_02893 [Bacillus pumilus]|uniref:Uncharacterized protein n=1 Tax=Bacillus pumilus TaxID=1408 RepID=A0AB34QVE1_BACPU|nr:hypothetical protein BAT_0306 [Bacillus pumilus ATCC 7061]KIL17691.1 hypothetical protein B4127_3317 [Bacillus pumilus]RAP12789.1 hypothetical protein C2W58_03129 [Bacillus pumilus]RAP23313.1 hypothetical protein C2W59_02893 [Bacillus pumilus]
MLPSPCSIITLKKVDVERGDADGLYKFSSLFHDALPRVKI